MKPVVNIDEVELQPRSAAVPNGAADRFEATFARIGSLVGAEQLGYNITAVPPGKSAFPYHSHRVNEEMFFVLRGTGDVRIGADKYPLRAGDIIACPAGGPENAHQINNTGDEDLRYLAVSTQRAPEIWEYPDSGKFGVIAEYPSSGGALSPPVRPLLPRRRQRRLLGRRVIGRGQEVAQRCSRGRLQEANPLR